jgi:vancomycin resistance protein YoaR
MRAAAVNKMRTRRVARGLGTALIAVVLALSIAVLGGAVAVRQFEAGGKIAPNVTISGVPVGGMDETEAARAVRTAWEARLREPVELRFDDGRQTLTRDQLGLNPLVEDAVREALKVGRTGGLLDRLATQLRLSREPSDLPIRAEVDGLKVRACIDALRPQVDRAARNAQVAVEGGRVKVTPGVVGRTLNVERSTAALAGALADPAVTGVDLVVETKQPDVTEKQLADLEVVLASYTTKFNPGKEDRTHNLRLAITVINKTVLDPGETFSFNQTVGEREASRGFRPAMVFASGDVRPELGGGMCQVSSTVYNAALLAGLDATERSPHQRPVDYIPMGRDATVYWGSKDFKFRNTFSHTIMLMAGSDDNSMWVTILGRAEDKVEVKLKTTDVSKGSAGTVEQVDVSLAPGQRVKDRPASGGGRATLWREIWKNGQLIKNERLHTDEYPSIPGIVRVGPSRSKPGTTLPPLPVAPGNEETGPGLTDTQFQPTGRVGADTRIPTPEPPASRGSSVRRTTSGGDRGAVRSSGNGTASTRRTPGRPAPRPRRTEDAP